MSLNVLGFLLAMLWGLRESRRHLGLPSRPQPLGLLPA